jgi:hypothetical protein
MVAGVKTSACAAHGNRALRSANGCGLQTAVLCTECMAGNGSTFQGLLLVAHTDKVAAINWGVAVKTQTYLPWNSWQQASRFKNSTVRCCITKSWWSTAAG